MGLESPSGQEAAFDQLMRIVFDQRTVFAGSRFALVGVADDVLRLGRGARHEAPLHPGRKTGAAASPQVRFLDFFDDRIGLHLEGLFQGLVAVVLEISVQRVRVGDTEPLCQHTDFVRARAEWVFVIAHVRVPMMFFRSSSSDSTIRPIFRRLGSHRSRS